MTGKDAHHSSDYVGKTYMQETKRTVQKFQYHVWDFRGGAVTIIRISRISRKYYASLVARQGNQKYGQLTKYLAVKVF